MTEEEFDRRKKEVPNLDLTTEERLVWRVEEKRADESILPLDLRYDPSMRRKLLGHVRSKIARIQEKSLHTVHSQHHNQRTVCCIETQN